MSTMSNSDLETIEWTIQDIFSQLEDANDRGIRSISYSFGFTPDSIVEEIIKEIEIEYDIDFVYSPRDGDVRASLIMSL